MRRLLMLASLMWLTILGCSFNPNKEILIGKYCLNRSNNRDSIFIYIDNSYTHQYISNEGKLFQIKGKWEFSSLSNEILFKDFVFFNDKGVHELPPGNWFSRIRSVDDTEIRLMYSSEDDIFFYKKK